MESTIMDSFGSGVVSGSPFCSSALGINGRSRVSPTVPATPAPSSSSGVLLQREMKLGLRCWLWLNETRPKPKPVRRSPAGLLSASSTAELSVTGAPNIRLGTSEVGVLIVVSKSEQPEIRLDAVTRP